MFLLVSGATILITGILASFVIPDPIGVFVLGFAGFGAVISFSGFLLYYNGRYADEPVGQ